MQTSPLNGVKPNRRNSPQVSSRETQLCGGRRYKTLSGDGETATVRLCVRVCKNTTVSLKANDLLIVADAGLGDGDL